jgi:WD40 repeat protein
MRRRILDVRFLTVSAAALIAVAELLFSKPVQKLPPLVLVPGEPGAQAISFAVSPNGKQLATTTNTGRIMLRAVKSGEKIERAPNFPGYAKAVAFSPDGRSLAAVGNNRILCVWNLTCAASEPTQTIAIPIERASRIMFLTDSQAVAITSEYDGTILLWDLATRRARMVLRHPPSPVVSIAFSRDGRWLASGGDRSMLLWDLQSRLPRTLLEDARGFVAALAFSPDGTLLASAGVAESFVRLWDLKTRRTCRVFEGHTRSVNSVDFSPDGSLLATAANDGTLGLWTVATGQRRLSLDTGATLLRRVSFSPDGRALMLATGNDDDIRLWNIAKLH